MTETVILIFSALISININRTPYDSSFVRDSETTREDPNLRKALTIGFNIAAAFAVLTFVLHSVIVPDGGWDAWQTWNLLARFIFRGGEHWKDAFSNLLAPHHPDYPLLIPASVARGWRYIGAESRVVPASIALLFTFATVGLTLSSVSLHKTKADGLLAGLFLLVTTNFVVLGSYQYADIPISFYFLAAMILLTIQERLPDNYCLSLLAGVMAGLSCWTKNEGFLFLMSIIIARFAVFMCATDRKVRFRQMLYLGAGTLPILLTVLYFKVFLAPPNDVFSAQPFDAYMYRLGDVSRYVQIAKSFFRISFNTIPLIVLLLYYLVYRRIRVVESYKMSVYSSLLTLIIMLAGYFMIYVITPHDLDWHLATSFSRLLLQLWPSVVFTCFLLVQTDRRWPVDAPCKNPPKRE